MEYIDFKIKMEDNTFNCFENYIKGIANYENNDYELMFVNALKFTYNSKTYVNELIGERIYTGNEHTYANLKKYHGMEIVFKTTNTETADYALNIIKSELKQNRPVIVGINEYWLPAWGDRYKNKKFPGDGEYVKGVNRSYHYVLAVGINLSKRCIYYYERLTEKTECVSIDDYINGCGPCAYYIINNDVKKSNDWKEDIRNTCNNWLGIGDSSSAFDDMLKLALEIEKLSDFQVELKGYEAYNYDAPIFRAIGGLFRVRSKFAIAIEYIVKKYNFRVLDSVPEELRLISKKWQIIINLLRILCYDKKNKTKIRNIAKRIREVAIEEKKLVNKIISIID